MLFIRSRLWSPELGGQNEKSRGIRINTQTLPLFLSSSTLKSIATEGGSRTVNGRTKSESQCRERSKKTSSSFRFAHYLVVLFSWRGLDVCFSSFLQSIINIRPLSVTTSVQLWASRAGFLPPSMRIRAPAHNNPIVPQVTSILSHPINSNARLYERIRGSELRLLAPMMRSRTL